MTQLAEVMKNVRSLFDIGDDLIALENIIAEADGDISDPAAEEAVTAWIAELASDQGRKLDGYINLMKKWESEAAIAQELAEEYIRRAKVREARVERFKQRLITHMVATNQKKIETASGRTLSLQANGGAAPITFKSDLNADDLPTEFQKVKYDVNRDAVRAALEAGRALDFAAFGQKGSHLRIR